MEIYVDTITRQRLERAAEQTLRTVADLAECALAESMLEWAKSNNFPGEDKPDMHPMKAGIVQVGEDLHKKHPIHDAIETAPEGEK